MATNNPIVGTTFNPSDPDLINLLSRKIAGRLHNSSRRYILDADVYAKPPYDLVAPAPGTGHGTGRKAVWYFFSPLHYSSPSRRGKRSRVVGGSRKGTWYYESRKRAQGSTHAGYRTYFSYEEKRGSETVKLGWSMMQYSIDGHEDIVLCKVYKPKPSQGLSRSTRAALQGMENILMADVGEDQHHVANDAANVALQEEMQNLLLSDGGEHQHHRANAATATMLVSSGLGHDHHALGHDHRFNANMDGTRPFAAAAAAAATGNTMLSRGLGHDHRSNVLGGMDVASPFNADSATATMLVSSGLCHDHPGLGHDNHFNVDMNGIRPFTSDANAAIANAILSSELGYDSATAAMLVSSGLGHDHPGLGHDYHFNVDMNGTRPFTSDADAATDNAMLSHELGYDPATAAMLVSSGLCHDHPGIGHDYHINMETNGTRPFTAVATGNAMFSPGLGYDSTTAAMLFSSGLGHDYPGLGHDHRFNVDMDGARPFTADATANAMLSPGLGHDHRSNVLGCMDAANPFNADTATAPAVLPFLSEVNQAVLGQVQYHQANDAAAAYSVGTHHLADNIQMVMNSQVAANDVVLRHLSAASNHIAAAVAHHVSLANHPTRHP